MAIVAIVPLAHEASDGRILVEAPAQTDRVEVTVSGAPARARLVARHERNGRLRITVQISAVARRGADLEVVARGGSRVLGRAVVDDVHLMGAGAFTRPRGPSTANARANAEALRIARGIGGPIGIRAECLGTGRTAEANADHVAVAASTLKVAILAAALAQDPEDPTRAQVYGTYRDAIVRSSNDAANRVLATVGDGSRAVGTRRVNTLMARLQMRSSFLDGPYRISGGASLKRTSALDLERLARAVYLAADGAGPLARLGVSRHETRVLIGLMAGENNPGLIRDHVPGPVAHKAGWLGGVQNDVALVFGTPGGTCLVGITTEHLAYAAAAAVGRDVADRVLPLLAARQPRSRSHAAPAGPAAATTSSSGRRPGPTRTSGSGGVPWGWIVAGAGMLVLAAGVATRCATTWRRQAELSDQKPNDGRR